MDASLNITTDFTHTIQKLEKEDENIKCIYINHILLSQTNINCYRGPKMGFNRRFVSRVGSDEAIGPGIINEQITTRSRYINKYIKK